MIKIAVDEKLCSGINVKIICSNNENTTNYLTAHENATHWTEISAKSPLSYKSSCNFCSSEKDEMEIIRLLARETGIGEKATLVFLQCDKKETFDSFEQLLKQFDSNIAVEFQSHMPTAQDDNVIPLHTLDDEQISKLTALGNAELDKKNFAAAIEYFNEAAQLGGSEAMRCLAVLNHNGVGMPQNKEQCIYWLTLAAEGGNSQAQNDLGDCYDGGDCVFKNGEKALYWHREAAKQGHLGSCLRLLDLDGGDSSYLQQLAANGNVDAQEMLGDAYIDHGNKWEITHKNLPKNNELGINWLKKAAENGSASAQHSLGHCYHSGYGVPVDLNIALMWYEKAVETLKATTSYDQDCLETKLKNYKWDVEICKQEISMSEFHLF